MGVDYNAREEYELDYLKNYHVTAVQQMVLNAITGKFILEDIQNRSGFRV